MSLYTFANAMNREDLVRALLTYRDQLALKAPELGGVEMMHEYSDLTDALIRRVMDVAIDGAGTESSGVRRKAENHIAIAAVGGYGRREMSPFSDVDVAFFVDGEEDVEIDLVVKRAFRILMDVIEDSRLKVGYSYRRADEVDHLPLETQTALLDARRIIGSESVFNTFKTALRDSITPAAFVIDHIKARGLSGSITPFRVEPDIKEGVGGLRDLHTARWISQIVFDLTNGNVWNGLRSHGILLDKEIEDIKAAGEFISRARNALHLLAQRPLDTLSVARHEQVAQVLGFDDPRKFISSYYSHSHHICHVLAKVVDACADIDLMIEPGVVVLGNKLRILDRGLLSRDPAAVLRLFQYVQSYDLKLDRDAGDMIANIAVEYRLTRETGHLFLSILAQPGALKALRSMADTGILQALIPQFSALMYLVPGDAAHRFTVGEHSLQTVRELENLLSEDGEQFVDVFSRIQHFDVLFLAALLHDIGKLDPNKDHCKSGAVQAAKLAEKLGMSEEGCVKVEFLVKNHLRMSETARLRDLQQKRTITQFVSVVKDPQLLDMLFLLTVADSRAVGESNWSRVQIRFLLELHDRAMAAIRSPDSSVPDIERHRSRVRRELCLANLPPDEVDEHCASMPASYLLNTPPDDLALHIGHVRTVRSGSPAVEIRDEPGGQFTELTVIAMDMPGLLSRIAGVLYALSIEVHAAQIFTRYSSDHIAIDVLYIDFEGRQLAEMKKWQVEGELLNVLSGNLAIGDLLKRWGKKEFQKPKEISVKVLENLSDHQTVVEMRTGDTPGLLCYLTRRISEQGFGIHSARISTWGREARDAFYLTNSEGMKLTPEQVEELSKTI